MVPRIGILGAPGSLGTLWTYHLLRNAQRCGAPPALESILLTRQQATRYKQISQITVESIIESPPTIHSIPLRSSNFQIVDENSNNSIDVVIVATKAYETTEALKPVLPQLSEKSTIVLLQNGVLGVYDEIRSTNPTANIVIASTTHGCYRQRPFHVVHAGTGNITFGTLDSKSSNKDNEWLRNYFTTRLSDLDAKWMDDPDMFLKMLFTKLTVNCAINPLTAVHRVRNGELLKNDQAMAWMKEVAKECADVFAVAHPTLSNLTQEYLESQIWDVARKTANNKSSMFQDVLRGFKQTEIDYMNGYVSRLGAKYGVKTPRNTSLTQMVKGI